MTDYNTRLLYLMKFFGSLTMRFQLKMKEAVNPGALKAAVEKSMKRYPYLAKKVAIENGTFVLKDNELPVPVIKTGTPMPCFGSKELNYHLICVDYDGNDIFINILHNLGGGRGLIRWMFSILDQYIIEISGKDPEIPGVRKCDTCPLPGEELVQPLIDLPDIELSWKGFPPEIKPVSPSMVEELLKEDKEEGFFVSVYHLDEKKVMEKVRECGATPSIWFAVIFYKALLKCLPDIPDCFDLGLTCDVSEQYGYQESMSLITKFLHLVIKKEDAGKDIPYLCKKGREEVRLQKDPGATNELFMKERDTLIEMEKLPSLDEKAGYYLKNSLVADMTPSALVSYIGKYDLDGIDTYVDSIIVRGFNATNGLEITAMNGYFLPELAHKYKDAKILAAFEELLKEQGIEILRAEKNIDQNNLGLDLPEE